MSPLLDMRTVILSGVVSSLVCAVVIGVLWAQNRRRFEGLGCWLADFGMQLAAVLLVALRGRVPDLVSMTASNALIVGGTVVLFIGLERFVDRRGAQLHNYFAVGAFTAAHAYFVLVEPDLTTRNILLSFGLLAICSQCAWLLLVRVGRELRPVTGGTATIFTVLCLVSVVRIALDLLIPSPADLFHSGLYQTLSVLMYQMLFVALTFSLVLMVNNRLVVDLSREIAGRRQTEAELRESEQRFRTLVASQGEGTGIVDVDEVFLFANPAAELLFGVAPGRLVGRSLSEFVEPDSWARIIAETGQRRRGLRSTYEVTIVRPDGQRRELLVTATAQLDAAGAYQGAFGVFRDISERKRAEEALRESEEKLRAEKEFVESLLEAAPDTVFVFEPATGRAVRWNSVFRRVTGYSDEEISSIRAPDGYYGADDLQRAGLATAKVLREGRSTVELSLITKDGRSIPYEYSVSVVPSPDGSPQLFVSIGRDITERLRAGEALRRLSHDLAERVKELDCLYQVGDLANRPGVPAEQVLQDIVDLLPAAYRYPEAVCARLTCEGRTYSTGNYRETPWKQTRDIEIRGMRMGTVEVCYLEEKPPGDEGPFLKEERLLITVVADRVGRIIERMRAEETLRLSEEKFFKAFHSSPEAILISRLSDAAIVEVNEGFCRLSGFEREACLSQTIESLGVLEDPGDQHRVTAGLQKYGTIRDWEMKFRSKSGKRVIGVYSGEILHLGGEAHALSVVHDVTELRRLETLTRLRLTLWEFAAAHSLGELMQKALDDIGELTESPIGFYHFVDEDQNALRLQAWSTPTKAEFCTAEGEGLHYPISQAGVWVDAFHQRRPVIHNDVAALPHRKGMPEGHAKVIRELVVPVLRSGRVVSILGVGNKASDYDEADVRLVSYVADVVWTITEQKLSEERIRELNARLETLAMTDELTGLANRRAFFERGVLEVRRARRFHAPFSLLLLDLDAFKRVNDTYGHEAGDRVLRCVVKRFRAHVREVDLLARLGGDEFAIVLTNVPKENAVVLGERLRQAIEKEPCDCGPTRVRQTMSVGVAGYAPEVQDVESLLRLADHALYRAKSLGRNRVECA